MPKVSVIMSVWNAGDYLKTSVASVLNQTFTDWEFIILDDGSSDGSTAYLKKLSCEDSRFKIVLSEDNLGLTRRLNEGLDLAEGELIARMDCDDICLPGRLKHQVEFLDGNPNVGLIGSDVWVIDEAGKRIRIKKNPRTDCEIRWEALLDNPFIHPAAMFRRSLIDEGLRYDPEFRFAQDYGLWSEMLKETTAATLPDALLEYRIHQNQVTVGSRAAQMQVHQVISENNIHHWLGVSFEPQEIQDLIHFAQGKLLQDIGECKSACKLVANYSLLLATFKKKYEADKYIHLVTQSVYERFYRSIRKSDDIVLAMKCLWYIIKSNRGFAGFAMGKLLGIYPHK